jgi:hypothetical protein
MEFDQKQKHIKRKKKDFPMHATKAYRGSGDISPLILNLCTIWKGTHI